MLVLPPADGSILSSVRPGCFATYWPQGLLVVPPTHRSIVPSIRPTCFTTIDHKARSFYQLLKARPACFTTEYLQAMLVSPLTDRSIVPSSMPAFLAWNQQNEAWFCTASVTLWFRKLLDFVFLLIPMHEQFVSAFHVGNLYMCFSHYSPSTYSDLCYASRNRCYEITFFDAIDCCH